MNNVKRLKKIMNDHGLTRNETAYILGVKKQTVDGWLTPEEKPSYRKMANAYIDLLTLKMEGR